VLSPSLADDPSMTCRPVYKRLQDVPAGMEVKNFAISVKCRQLIKMDWLSLSDPIVVLSQYNPDSGVFESVGNTEWQFDTHNPDYQKKVLLPNNKNMGVQLEFSVFDVDTNSGLAEQEVFEEKDRMGSAIVNLDILKQSMGAPQEFSLRNLERKKLDAQLVQSKAVIIVLLEIGQVQAVIASQSKPKDDLSSSLKRPSSPLSSSLPKQASAPLSSSVPRRGSNSKSLSALDTESRYTGHGSVPQKSSWIRRVTGYFKSNKQTELDAVTESLLAQDAGKLDWEDPSVEYSSLGQEHSQLYLYIHGGSKSKEETCCSCCPLFSK